MSATARRPASSRALAVGLLALLASTETLPARAQDRPGAEPPTAAPSDESHKAAAQALFDEGTRLVKSGRQSEACAAFAESYRLDAAIGTRFNLAECYEQLGKLASAWAHYVGVADAAQRMGQEQRAAYSRARAASLEPRLPRLRIVVADPHPELTVRRGDRVVGRAQWSHALPVDPGEQRIVAVAPGRRTWIGRAIAAEGSVVEVTVPVLAVEPVSPSPPGARPGARPSMADRGWPPQRVAGVAIAAGGLVGIGVGSVLALVAKSKKDDAAPRCPREGACFDDGKEQWDDARTVADGATVAFVAGGVLLAAGIVVWLTAPSRDAVAIGRGAALRF